MELEWKRVCVVECFFHRSYHRFKSFTDLHQIQFHHQQRLFIVLASRIRTIKNRTRRRIRKKYEWELIYCLLTNKSLDNRCGELKYLFFALPLVHFSEIVEIFFSCRSRAAIVVVLREINFACLMNVWKSIFGIFCCLSRWATVTDRFEHFTRVPSCVELVESLRIEIILPEGITWEMSFVIESFRLHARHADTRRLEQQ